MLLQKTQSRALLAQAFELSRKVISVRWVSKKADNVKRIRTRRLEEKILFGDLVETKRDKVKRVKLEETGKVAKAQPSALDSELNWVLNSSSSNVKILKPRASPKSTHKTENISTCVRKDCDVESALSSESSAKTGTNLELSANKDADEVNETVNTNNRVTFNNSVLQFPLLLSDKKLDEPSRSAEVLSISAPEKVFKKFPSVTKILTETMSEESRKALEKWKASMIEKYGVRGFDLYQKELFEEGRLLHAAIVNNLVKKPINVPDKIKKSYNSLSGVFSLIDDVRSVESYVVHPKLMYKGILDCVALYGGELCLIDWKKSDRMKNTINATYDAPVQVAAYIGALNSDLKYPFQIKKGLVVVAYTNGDPATIHEINGDAVQKYWTVWLERLQNYQVVSPEDPK